MTFLAVSALVLVLFFFTLAKVLGRPQHQLSRPAKKLYKEYKTLPVESRPFPDILSILTTLDKRWAMEREALNGHFMVLDYDTSHFKWSHYSTCQHNTCSFKDYYEIHTAIKEVSNALVHKEKVILERSVDTGMAKSLAEALRREAEIQREVIGELK